MKKNILIDIIIGGIILLLLIVALGVGCVWLCYYSNAKEKWERIEEIQKLKQDIDDAKELYARDTCGCDLKVMYSHNDEIFIKIKLKLIKQKGGK